MPSSIVHFRKDVCFRTMVLGGLDTVWISMNRRLNFKSHWQNFHPSMLLGSPMPRFPKESS